MKQPAGFIQHWPKVLIDTEEVGDLNTECIGGVIIEFDNDIVITELIKEEK